MDSFLDQDRILLRRACELARDERRAPGALGQKVEPGWAALLAVGGEEIAAAVFSAGDAEDAVKRLEGALSPDFAGAEATLYLTMEPKASFDRLPPVTESVRRLGVGRVVIGTLDPSARSRGDGSQTLTRMGVSVVMADGEEARLAQQILENYGKWASRGLAVLTAQVKLARENDGSLGLRLARPEERETARADALLGYAGGPFPPLGDSWRVVLDPEGWDRPREHTLVYRQPEAVQPGTRSLVFAENGPVIGALLRDLASLGLLSVEIVDPLFFRQALRAGLVDSVVASFDGNEDSVQILSLADRVQVQGGEPMALRLGGAHLLGERSLEARVELC